MVGANLTQEHTAHRHGPMALQAATFSVGAPAIEERGRFSVQRYLPVLGIVSVSIISAAALVYFQDSIAALGQWGYVGLFVTQVVNSASIFLPTVGQAYVFATAPSFDPVLMGVVGGVGAALGELTGYALGASGREAIQKRRWYGKTQGLMARWGGGGLFAFALLPLPFDVAGIWAGTTRYPVWRFVAYVAAGKIFRVMAIALVGQLSVPHLAQMFG